MSSLCERIPIIRPSQSPDVQTRPWPWLLAAPIAHTVYAPGSPRPPSSAVTWCCVCLSRAMVCSQRNASLSQSPRVGFLSSLLPQSKKSPSRLSPAQGPAQPQSSAKKESFGSQVSTGPASNTPLVTHVETCPPSPWTCRWEGGW